MIKYIVRRILVTIPLLLGIVFLTFTLMNLVPGNPIAVLLDEKMNPEMVERLTRELHLNDPAHVKFFKYIQGLLRGDMGKSIIMNQSVSKLIWDVFPNTVRLTLCSIAIAWLTGIPAGIIAALKQGTAIDRIISFFSVAHISIPSFFIGMALQYVVAYKWNLLPISGFYSFKHIILPAVVLSMSLSGQITRLIRSNMLTVLNSDYVKTAISKGQSSIKIVIFHELRNCLLPVITIMLLQVTALLGGAIITESVFAIPGIGTLSISALTNRDMPLLQGTIILSTALIIAGNLLADIICAFIDPRIRAA